MSTANGIARFQEREKMLWLDPSAFDSEQFQKYLEYMPGLDLKNWNNPDVKKANRELMRRKSSVLSEIGAHKGGWKFPEKVYLSDPNYASTTPEAIGPLDQLLVSQKLPMSYSLKVRFDHITKGLLPGYINEILKTKGQVKIASFGSGTGRDVMTAMETYNGNVSADFYDIDPTAIVEGRRIAEEKGLDHKVRFIEEDLARIQERNYDLGLVVGIICPLEDRSARIVLKALKRNMSPGGYLIVSSSSDKMENQDPLSRFLIEYIADWFLEFRDGDRMKSVMESAGLNVVNNTQEPSGYNKLSICRTNLK